MSIFSEFVERNLGISRDAQRRITGAAASVIPGGGVITALSPRPTPTTATAPLSPPGAPSTTVTTYAVPASTGLPTWTPWAIGGALLLVVVVLLVRRR